MSYQLSPQAEADLEEIGDYIADDNPENARRFIERLTSKLEALGRHPMMGRARPELRSDMRSFPYGAYLILYRSVGDGVEIVRVVHAARNLDDLI
jgi:toxin ParE1/3/4